MNGDAPRDEITDESTTGDSEDEGFRTAEAESEPAGDNDFSILDWLTGDDSTAESTPGTTDEADKDDLGPPYLIVDQYSGDSGPRPPWEKLVDSPTFYGAIVKAWEGTQFNDGGWFRNNWPAIREVGGDRYGRSWFRGAYLFLKFMQSATEQADAYLSAVDEAGGWDSGDIVPVVDVEQGGKKNTNRQASAQQVIDCVTECASRLREQTGRRIMLYGRGAMRDLGINDRMGCDVVWNPSYTAKMVRNGLQAWDLEEIVLWQYCGDNFAANKNLPNTAPGFAKVDISVFIKGAQRPTLQDVRDSLLG
jgi:GH25 family lysozyme M1 (1,4-beta-N-acetylmuramidase)